MNKRFSLLLVTFFIISLLRTQAQDQKFHFGLKVAPTSAWLKSSSKDIKKGGSKLGFSYGMIAEFNFAEKYAFATGIQVTYRGGKLKYPVTGTSDYTTQSIILKYIELPLCIKMKTTDFGKFKYFGQVGLVPGFNIMAKDGDDNDINDDISLFNLSTSLSIGTEYTISGTTVLVGSIEFNNGFLDVVTDPPGVNANTNYLALNIGVLF